MSSVISHQCNQCHQCHQSSVISHQSASSVINVITDLTCPRYPQQRNICQKIFIREYLSYNICQRIFVLTCPRYPQPENICLPQQSGRHGSTKQLGQVETLATLIIVMMMMVSNSCVQINEESEFGIHIVDNTICKFSAQGRDKFYMSPKHFLSNVRQDIQSLLV